MGDEQQYCGDDSEDEQQQVCRDPGPSWDGSGFSEDQQAANAPADSGPAVESLPQSSTNPGPFTGMYDGPNQSIDPDAGPNQSIDPDAGPNQSIDPDAGPNQCIDPDWGSGDSSASQAEETPGDKPAVKSPSEMTPEEREADRTAKMEEYAKQSPEEKEARWANNNGKLSQEAWDKIQQMKSGDQKQAMLQAGIDKLDYDDPRRAQLEKIQHWMGNKDAVTPGSQPPPGETNNLLTRAGRTGGPDEAQLKPGETRCGEVAGQMLNFTKGDKAPGLPPGGYFNTKGCEADDKNATPGSGDVFHLRNEAKGGNAADDNGHASMFVVSSPDGAKWLTFDGGQGSANGENQKIALSMRNVSVDENGRTMVSGADNGARAVSRRWDYEKMYKKYLSPPQPTQ